MSDEKTLNRQTEKRTLNVVRRALAANIYNRKCQSQLSQSVEYASCLVALRYLRFGIQLVV